MRISLCAMPRRSSHAEGFLTGMLHIFSVRGTVIDGAAQVLCGFILLFLSITAFSLKRFNFQQR